MGTTEIFNLITMSELYHCRPSEMLDLMDDYTAYCFDEACTYIKLMSEEGKEATVHVKYNSFAEMYKEYQR